MQEINSIVNGRVFPLEQIEPLLIPLVLSQVSAGFPSPADEHIETSINLNKDLNKELIRHLLCSCERRFNDRDRHPSECRTVIDRMVETRLGDDDIAQFGDELCVKELFIDDEGKVFLVQKNVNYKPIVISEDPDFEIWEKVICAINKF